MCLLLLAYQAHARYPLIVAANRDEFLARPTAPAQLWEDESGVLAGRDLVGGGTWLGIGPGGRFAALTNYRDPARLRPEAPSRGALVTGFLTGKTSEAEYVSRVRRKADRYNGFNLVMRTTSTLGCYSNVDDRLRPMEPGVHGLSNHLLNIPWPKVKKGRRGMTRLLEMEGDQLIDELFVLLRDETRPPDSDLPSTGVALPLEQGLSPMFIRLPGYGTRSSTVVLIDRNAQVILVERSYGDDGRETHLFRHG